MPRWEGWELQTSWPVLCCFSPPRPPALSLARLWSLMEDSRHQRVLPDARGFLSTVRVRHAERARQEDYAATKMSLAAVGLPLQIAILEIRKGVVSPRGLPQQATDLPACTAKLLKKSCLPDVRDSVGTRCGASATGNNWKSKADARQRVPTLIPVTKPANHRSLKRNAYTDALPSVGPATSRIRSLRAS